MRMRDQQDGNAVENWIPLLTSTALHRVRDGIKDQLPMTCGTNDHLQNFRDSLGGLHLLSVSKAGTARLFGQES